jgi:hypothetical protein
MMELPGFRPAPDGVTVNCHSERSEEPAFRFGVIENVVAGFSPAQLNLVGCGRLHTILPRDPLVLMSSLSDLTHSLFA